MDNPSFLWVRLTKPSCHTQRSLSSKGKHTMSPQKAALLSILTIPGALHVIAASAQGCTPITATPTTISAPGKYCATQHLRYDGPSVAINISSDDVVLDFDGYTLQAGGGALTGNSIGVYSANRSNVTIRNGAIRNFASGLQLIQQVNNPSRGNLVEHMLIEGARSTGIVVSGRNPTVRDNRIANLASTSTTSAPSGLLVMGAGARILNNSISDIVSPYIPIGIYVTASGSMVQNNVVSDLGAGANGRGFGILIGSNVSSAVIENNTLSQSSTQAGIGLSASSGATNMLVQGNTISGYGTGISLGASPSSKYKNNTVFVTGLAYSGGIDLGGNN